MTDSDSTPSPDPTCRRRPGNSGTGGPAGSALLNFPIDVGTDPAGDVFIPDQESDTILEAVRTATPAFPVTPAGARITVTQPGGA